jgi:uncharacterized protein (TIGR03437 family)
MSRTRIVRSLLLAAGAALGPALAQQYVISTYAGGAPSVPTPARGKYVSIVPLGVATDAAGSVYFTSTSHSQDPICIGVFKLDRNDILTRVAGNCRCGYSGDGGPAASAQLCPTGGVAVDSAGNLFVADGPRIRKVSPDGIIATVAVVGGLAPDVAVDGFGNLFIAEAFTSRILKVSPDGIMNTVAGTGTAGFSGDGGPATSAALNSLHRVAVDGSGNVFFGDLFRIRKVSPDGIITTVAATTTSGAITPVSVAVDAEGNLFIADDSRIRRVSPDGIITTVAGTGTRGFSGDGGPATAAELDRPTGVAVDGAGNLFIADNNRIRKVSASGVIATVAGNGAPGRFSFGDGGPATAAGLHHPVGVAVDGAGNLFITEVVNRRVRRVSPDGIITTVAGGGSAGLGDGGPATSAELTVPYAVAVDSDRNLFIADIRNHRIRRVSSNGMIATVAGTGTQGFSGDGGPATAAELDRPVGVAVDSEGKLFIAELGNHRIRRISSNGMIATVAGGGTTHGGDGGPATNADIRFPNGVAVDGAGNLFLTTSGADYEIPDSERVRKVSRRGIITTLAGDGTGGFCGDGGPASGASLIVPIGLAVDSAGNVYVADTYHSVVRILRPMNYSLLIGAVVDAASQRADPVSPGKIVGICGVGLGPSALVQNQPRDGQFSTELAGTTVSFNGIAAPILYTSATQVATVAPYALRGTTAQVTVTYQGETSNSFTVPVAASAPSIFTSNRTGAGQAAAINAVDRTGNTAANPVKIGSFVTLYATGEGKTDPAGTDGRLSGSTPARPVLPVRATVGGIPATVQYAGGTPGQVAGLMQVNVQIPDGVQPGGYVLVVLQVGDRTSGPAVWIAVSRN